MLTCNKQTISIRNLRIPTIIGVYDQERLKEQYLTCNIDLKINRKAIFISDKLCDTVDYATVANRVSAFVRAQKSHLIEHVAHLAVREIFAVDLRISGVRIEIFKSGCIENGDGAAIKLEYVRDEPLSDEAS